MKTDDSIIVELVDWLAKEREIYSVRKVVFVDEQKVPEDIEMDDRDRHCQHVLACDSSGRPIGTGRLDVNGKIGRMAVLADCRGTGIGKRILETLIQYGKGVGMGSFKLSAQLHAVGFYEKYGFVRYGEEFEEAGIPHVMMRMG